MARSKPFEQPEAPDFHALKRCVRRELLPWPAGHSISRPKVDFTGGPPDLFKDCAPAVVNGHWQGTTFVADQLLIKHGSDYDSKQRTDAACRAGATTP